MSTLRITVKHLQHGQPRAYADHVYSAEITTEGDRAWERLTESQMRHVAQGVVHPFTDDPEDGSMEQHFRPRLRELRQVSSERTSEHPLGGRREVWMVEVTEPYCD